MRAICDGFIEMTDRERMEYLLKRKFEFDSSGTGPEDRKGKRKLQSEDVVENSVNKSPAREAVAEGTTVNQEPIILRSNQGIRKKYFSQTGGVSLTKLLYLDTPLMFIVVTCK